ncbi:MAG: tetratricopeptide repeat protein [Phycisphaerales bacterium]|nr:tetratricopeptide repeat protein [Phycisphaerales bacterium]
MKTVKTFLVTLLVTSSWCSSSMATLAEPDMAARMEAAGEAEQAYLEGLELQDSDPQEARERFQAAALGFRTVIDEGANSSGAWFNLGNALLRSEEIGEAIVAYRKAARLDPSNDDVSANLAEARRRVENRIQPDAMDLSFETVTSWWHPLAPVTRLWITLSAWAAFWLILALGSGRRRKAQEGEFTRAAWQTCTWAPAGIAGIVAATLLFDAAMARLYPVGVLINPDIVLRSGNGDGFGAAVEEPLAEGVEFTILEQRPGWWRVELADGTTGWISETDASTI